MLGQLKRTGGASWRLRGGRHLLASKRFGEDEACRLREIWFWGVWAREGERGGWLKSAADCQGGGMAWARALGPGVLRCAAHAAHCLVGIRTRAGVCANAALHCNNQSMHGGRRSRARGRACAASAAATHDFARSKSPRPPRGLRFKQNRIETSIQNRKPSST